MDRDTAVALGQQAIKAKNKRMIDQLLAIKAEREAQPQKDTPVEELPMIAVTCSTGWECYAVVQELAATRKFRVRALYRTPGTKAAKRLETLLEKTEKETPGLLTLHSGVDMFSEEKLTEAFAGATGVVLYVTANESKAGKIDNHGNDPVGGRPVVMRQVMAMLGAIKANPSVKHAVTLTFPVDKVRGIASAAPEGPWWIQQRLRIPAFLRGQGVNTTCLHRPAYYYGMHRVDYTDQAEIRGDSSLSKTMIKENCMPGIMEPDFMVNWVDVRDVGKWVGTIFEYPEVFSNEDFSIASTALTGMQRVAMAEKLNKHGVKFKYKQFPKWLIRMLSIFTKEVMYPLRYTQWYNDEANGYDFASVEDLKDLERVHPLWTFERKLADWGIDEIKPGQS